MNKGKIVTTRYIPLEYVQRIKAHLADSPRELAYFTLSVNSAFRGGDLLLIERSDLQNLPDGRMEIHIRERKTKRLRRVIINEVAARAVRRWLLVHPQRTEYLFEGQRGKMGTAYWAQMIKEWCEAVGAPEGNYATHSLRKSFARIQHEEFGTRLTTLMHTLNHSSERQTLTYLGLLGEDIEKVYSNVI